MKRGFLVATLCFSAAFQIGAGVSAQTPKQASAPPELVAKFQGEWSGRLHRGGDQSDLRLHIEEIGGSGGGSVSWAGLGYLDTPLLGSSVQDDGRVRISVPLPMGTVRLIGNSDGKTLTGVLEEIGRVDGAFASLGVNGTFEFQRSLPGSPQYAVQPTLFRGEDGTVLAGSLFVPFGKGPFPAVVYVHGSGDSSRFDGAFLADNLARRGIATFAYDKRGVGSSQGQWRNVSMETLAGDARAALVATASHPAIDQDKVGYVGRSQAGWIVPMALRKGGAAFAAFISGAAVSPVDEDLDHYRQRFEQSGRTKEQYAAAEKLLRLRYSAMRGGISRERLNQVAALSRRKPWFSLLEWDNLDREETAFDRSWIRYDPTDDLKAIDIPTLWLFGSGDYVIPVGASAANVISLVRKSPPTVEVLPGADHALASGNYPRLPFGVDSATRRIGDWIVGITLRQ